MSKVTITFSLLMMLTGTSLKVMPSYQHREKFAWKSGKAFLGSRISDRIKAGAEVFLNSGYLNALNLRGGVWYSGSDGEDSEEYSEEYTDEESRHDEAKNETVAQTDEEKAEALMVPLGGWRAGQFPDIMDRFELRDARENGPIPSDIAPPHYVDEIYGLGKYTFLADDFPNQSYDNSTRSLLKVPPEELPPVFHWPSCGDALGVLNNRHTLAERFAEWSGPTPHFWQARVISPRGVIMAHSMDRWVDRTLEDVAEELGGEECAAYFMHVTRRRHRLGQYVPEKDGAWVPGPSAFTPDVTCGRADPPPPLDGGGWDGDAPPADGQLRDVAVPGDCRWDCARHPYGGPSPSVTLALPRILLALSTLPLSSPSVLVILFIFPLFFHR